MLVGSSIYQACKFYELFCQAGFKGKCAIVTSYEPQAERHLQGRLRRGRDREAAPVRDLPPDAGRPLRRAGRHGDEQGRAVREGGQGAVRQRSRPDAAADRRRQAAHRLRRADRHLPLHRQEDAGPRPVPGHLPRQPARRRRQGLRLHRRLPRPVQLARDARSPTTPAALSTATRRRTSKACSPTASRRPARTSTRRWRRSGRSASRSRRRRTRCSTSTTSARPSRATPSSSRPTSRSASSSTRLSPPSRAPTATSPTR